MIRMMLVVVLMLVGCGRQYYLPNGEGCITIDGLQYRPTMPYECPYEYARDVPPNLRAFH